MLSKHQLRKIRKLYRKALAEWDQHLERDVCPWPCVLCMKYRKTIETLQEIINLFASPTKVSKGK